MQLAFKRRLIIITSATVLLLAIVAVVKYTAPSAMRTSPALSEKLPATLQKTAAKMTPERALSIALETLARANIDFEMHNNYKITMKKYKDGSGGWGVEFAVVPEVIGGDVWVGVESDGSSGLTVGR
jgi:hypothetical protein